VKTTKEYINELEILVEQEFTMCKKKIEVDSNRLDEIFKQFQSTISRLGTDLVHRTLMDGLTDSQLPTLVTVILSKATAKFNS
jgi:SPX domain protein involved in polyphosphate accumulation